MGLHWCEKVYMIGSFLKLGWVCDSNKGKYLWWYVFRTMMEIWGLWRLFKSVAHRRGVPHWCRLFSYRKSGDLSACERNQEDCTQEEVLLVKNTKKGRSIRNSCFVVAKARVACLELPPPWRTGLLLCSIVTVISYYLFRCKLAIKQSCWISDFFRLTSDCNFLYLFDFQLVKRIFFRISDWEKQLNFRPGNSCQIMKIFT